MDFRGRRRGEDGLAVIVDFLLANARIVLGVGGAAVLGIATLAVKRLIERAGRPPDDKPGKMADSWEELGLVTASPELLRRGIAGAVMKQIRGATKARKADLCLPSPLEEKEEEEEECGPPRLQLRGVLTLQERLQQYYGSRVALSPAEVSHAQARALDICTEIQGFLLATLPDMPLGEMHLGGSLLDDLQVVCADHACLLVPLLLEPGLWSLISGEETILRHPQQWMVRRVNLEYFPRGRSFWDRFLVGGYLSSRGVVELLHRLVMETLNWPSLGSTLECAVRPVLGSLQLKLEVRSEEVESPPLFIHILPVLRQGDKVLVARPELTSAWDSAWLLSLYTSETQRLAGLDRADGGARRCCLKILKAVCRNCPALRKLTAGPLTSLVLHLSDREADWSESRLAERFQQAISELIGYLERGRLPSYFLPAVNLLCDLTEDEVDEMGFMLYCSLSEPDILLI